MKKALSLALMLFALTFSSAAHAIGIYEDGVREGQITDINFGTGLNVAKSGGTFTITADPSDITSAVFEGTTADANETTLAVVDPTADNTFTLPDDSGYAMFSTLATNKTQAANSVWFVSNGMVFEGATADAFEMTVSPADVGADVSVTLPTSAAAVGVFYTSLVTNSVDVANSVTGTSNGFIAEGATADGFETTVAFADPGADFTLTIPASTAAAAPMLTSLTTNAVDVATAVTGAANGFIAEGTTADAFETSFTFADPTADQTVTVPATAGAAGTVELKGVTVVITAGTTPTLTVPVGVNFIATDTITTDNQDQTITFSSGGTLGQTCSIVFQTDSGGSADEVITFHTTLTNTSGTLTLANLTAGRYVVNFQSDGTVFNETSRTLALS